MSNRIERANSELQRCIADIITKLNDPRLPEMIYISEVKVTPDFKYCKIKVSVDTNSDDQIKTTISILQKSEGFIKRELADKVRMPQMPKLTFEYDKGAAASIRINEILKTLNIPEADDEDNDPNS